MSDVVISVENVSKCYRLGAIGTRTLSGDFERWWARLRGKPDPFLRIGQKDHANRQGETIWALRDVSFEVRQGEVLGIIGRNGAGKSTLLKILSRITAPTTGQIKAKGRVASLLEVGTGFHPELTGRENIYLNGAILGMKRAEIARKFDEIVDFSGVEQFIDTPVKRYSSGMYVRLAFAVAAHLEPEILLVDEVLAVGDAEFQKKCLGKMGEVAQGGRTVLFVSHNMAAIQTLCIRAVLLGQGRIVANSTPESVVGRYLGTRLRRQDIALCERTDRIGNGRLAFTDVRFLNRLGRQVDEITSGDQLTIEVSYLSDNSIDATRMIFAISFWDQFRNPVVLFASDEMGTLFKPFTSQGCIRVFVPQLPLRGGTYSMQVQASHLTTGPESFYDRVEDAATLHVLPGDYWKSGYTNRAGSFCIVDARLSND